MPAELDLTHLNLDARDLDASLHFYRELLRLPVTRREQSLRVEHPSYLLVLNAGEPQTGGSFHFGFRVESRSDVDEWTERLRAGGVPIVVEPQLIGSVYVARVTDPNGYAIEIYTGI